MSRQPGKRIRDRIDAAAAKVAVAAILLATAVSAHLFALLWLRPLTQRRVREFGRLRLLVSGTFYNPGWFRSHIVPLSRAQVLERVCVVTDEPLFPLDKVCYACPPRWLSRVCGRNVARTLTLLCAALRHRPDYVMGYHIMPNALQALVAARLCNGRAIYQMTGGPVQIVGGGVGSENFLLHRLKAPSRVLEALMYHCVRCFDLIVVRGSKAVQFLRENRLAQRVEIVPGSVDTDRFQPIGEARPYDLVMVARLIEPKQPHLFVELVGRLVKKQPHVRAAMVGDGPLIGDLRALARRLGVESHVHFLGKLDRVERVLAESRVFVLTSNSEGLSIAMIEAMSAGLPVVAADVGDLGELLKDGMNGLFVDPQDIEATAHHVGALLADVARWKAMSRAARHAAVDFSSITSVAQRWDKCLVTPLGGAQRGGHDAKLA